MTLLARRSEYRWAICNRCLLPAYSRDRSSYKSRNIWSYISRSKGKAMAGVWINLEVTLSRKESDKRFYSHQIRHSLAPTYLENRSSLVMSHIFVRSIPVISDERVKGYYTGIDPTPHWKGEQCMKWTCLYLQCLVHEWLLLEKKLTRIERGNDYLF